jgi:hypothetical protein
MNFAMSTILIQRLMTVARRALILTGIGLLLLPAGAVRAQESMPYVAFGVEFSGNSNVPTIRVTNLSRNRQINKVTFFIGDTRRHFDLADTTVVSAPPYGTASAAVVGGARRGDFLVVDLTGFDPGESFTLSTDVDLDLVGNSVEDYRTVFFNNGGLPNMSIAADSGDLRGTLTLPDPPAGQSRYYFELPPPRRTLTIRSVTEAERSALQVERLTLKINDVVWPGAVDGFIGDAVLEVADGDTVEVSAPQQAYRDLVGTYLTDSADDNPDALAELAQERFTPIGITVNNQLQTGDPTLYRFDIGEPTVLVVKWRHEYALTVTHDTQETQSRELDEFGNPWVGPLTTYAAGDPVPEARKHWVARGASVTAEINGAVLDLTHPGLDVRYVPKGFRASGPPNPATVQADDAARVGGPAEYLFAWDQTQVASEADLRVPQAPPLRQQVRAFTMYGPGKITYVWQLQFGVRVNADDLARAGLPRIFQSTNNTWLPVNTTEGLYWFNPGTRLRVASAARDRLDTGLALGGWINGDGHYFSGAGTVDTEDGSLVEGSPATRLDGSPVAGWIEEFTDGTGVRFRGLEIPNLNRAARVLWRYGTEQIKVTVDLGKHVFQDTAYASAFSLAPEQIERVAVTGTRQDVAAQEMAIWDPAGQRLYPLVPGVFKALWRPGGPDSAPVEVLVTAVYPARAHYPHIAEAPPVALDPDPTDDFVFKEIRYSENDASVDGNRWFTATTPGRTVLLFSELQRVGRGEPREFLRVRVVHTRRWNDALATQTAVIGRKIVDTTVPRQFDRAGLGTGYVFFEGARYNPFVYDAAKLEGLAAKDVYDMAALRSEARERRVVKPENLPGPIIPVNVHPGAASDERIVVVWYDDPTENDELLWPHRATVHFARWPATAQEGLGRIVIASQFGSESWDVSGADQVVVGAVGNFPAETTYNPTRVQEVQVYSQPDPAQPGYNPNEEHGLMAPSLRFASVSPRPPAAYALRDNDLNVYNRSNSGFAEEGENPLRFTSHPFVLVQFRDRADGEFKMRVYRVWKEDRNLPGYRFADPARLVGATPPAELVREPHVRMFAGEPVIPFYPLAEAIGASPLAETFGTNLKGQAVYWEDYKGTSWAVSGGSDAWFTHSVYYPLAPSFWWPANEPGFLREVVESGVTVNKATVPQAGDPISFLPRRIDSLRGFAPDATVSAAGTTVLVADVTPTRVLYRSEWPAVLPTLKAGETLTFSGGEYRAERPFQPAIGPDGQVATVETPGLPGVVAFASAEVVFDSLNPLAQTDLWATRWTARVAQVLDVRSVPLGFGSFPPDLQPATRRTRVQQGKYVFNELPASLQNRVRYDPLSGRLEMHGRLNEKEIGERTLTASPPAVYVLEPNIITREEEEALAGLSPDSKWQEVVRDLAKLSRNPSLISRGLGGGLTNPSSPDYRSRLEAFWAAYYASVGALPPGAVVPLPVSITAAGSGYEVGLEPEVLRDAFGRVVTIEDPAVAGLRRVVSDPRRAAPVRAFGPGLAVIPNADFLNPTAGLPEISYVSVVENNDESLQGSPVTVHIIKVDRRERYRGAIKTVLSDNVFDENIVLRHQGDFGANADALAFEWWYRPDDGSLNVPPPDLIPPGNPNPWKLFPDPTGQRGVGRFQATLKGNPNAPEALLADTFWFVRYRHVNDVVEGTRWDVRQPDGRRRVNFMWAGAGNSDPFNDFDLDGFPDYRAQLAQGWIKRVLDAVNPYEARIRDFEGDSPSTQASLISQLGARYEGPVALNPDKNVIENVGLIELYETILKRGRDLSIDLSRPVSTPAIANALQLVSTRISDFYVVLGNEAYADAVDPSIGFGSDSGVEFGNDNVDYGSAGAYHAFQNQMSTLIEEELALLRGVDDNLARPVYNRLFWNFTKGEGEAAYAMNYNISDVNGDGFIDERDAMILYPQGHGDAWGHYLTALRNQYDLLRAPNFNWVSRSEFYNLMDVVFKVDFLDERKFAQAAAAKAKVGAEIVNLTYRDRYVSEPEAQWQGYTDTNPDRAWGVEEWARRSGQGTYFDWITANALLPARHPNETLEGIQRVDRGSNADLAVVSANLNAIQQTFDQANDGRNPLGLSRDAVPFDVSPAQIDDLVFGMTHFEQVYERAKLAMENAVAVWNHANEPRNRIRQVANSEAEFRNTVFQEDVSYRNQLIKIFGRPYEGTIGPGRVYPAGYNGPDTLLHMYVDIRTIDNTTVPGPTTDFAVFTGNAVTGGQIYQAYVNGQGAGGAPRATISNIQRADVVTLQGYLGRDVRALFAPTFTPDERGVSAVLALDGLYAVNYTDLDPEARKVPLTNLNLPVTAAGYTFQAPRDWGSRLAAGELQLLINRMLQQEAQIASAIGAWDALSGEIVRTLRLLNATLDKSANVRLKNEIFSRTKLVIMSLIQGIEGTREILSALKDTTDYTVLAVTDAIPDMTPILGFSNSAGDILGPAEAAAWITGGVVKQGISVGEAALKFVKLGAEIGLSIAENELELFEKREDDALAAKDLLKGLEDLVGDEPIKRIEIFKEIHALRELSEQYRALVNEGTRLIDERAAFNKRVAAQTQLNRYQDVTFRATRNHALQSYRGAFDLAARYAYLAARAYDYETSFDPGHPAAPTTAYRDIVRSRGLGLFDDDARFGGGGLSEALAWLRTQYRQQKGQLGINNPQYETGKMSLRTELFRILPPEEESEAMADPDELWRETLRAAVVDNLWMVPEFRYYCNPFASPPNPAAVGVGEPLEPAIVLRFGTEIHAGRNFFGRPLSGGDHAYDPSHFATKIRAIGMWFSDYQSASVRGDLPATPRVYLIPAGIDVLRNSGAEDPNELRYWRVFDQRIPVPMPALSANIQRAGWIPLLDSLNGRMGEPRKFSMFRAYHDGFSEVNTDELVTDSRLIGRSIWNTHWVLIIPGRTLNANPRVGLERFIDQVTDIKLVFQTYGYAGD